MVAAAITTLCVGGSAYANDEQITLTYMGWPSSRLLSDSTLKESHPIAVSS